MYCGAISRYSPALENASDRVSSADGKRPWIADVPAAVVEAVVVDQNLGQGVCEEPASVVRAFAT